MKANISLAEGRKLLSKKKRSEDRHYVPPADLSFVDVIQRDDLVDVMIPFPPSVNVMYRTTPNGMRLSTYGREYKDFVLNLLWSKGAKPIFPGDLQLSAVFQKPDNRKRDLDNLLKASLDVVGAAFQFDDSRIVRYKDVSIPRMLRVHYSYAYLQLTKAYG